MLQTAGCHVCFVIDGLGNSIPGRLVHDLILALMRVKLSLDCRLRVSLVGISRELGVALFADPDHGNVSDALDDPKVALRHGTVSHS